MTFVYDLRHPFGPSGSDVSALIGGKAASLWVMASELGLPVPPGFVITTEACRTYVSDGWPDGLDEEIREHLSAIEEQVGRRFADPADPLLVSIRSGAPVSMPGMMDTILNLGLTPETTEGLASRTGDPEFAQNCLARFEAMYRTTVGRTPPADPAAQLRAAIEAVFRSWDSERARAYRQVEGIPDGLGTAVTVQAMVFGNRGGTSGTGVLFTRNPSTGEQSPYGDIMFEAQGEDVVAGTHHTEPVTVLDERMPAVAERLWWAADALEQHYADMCDIEFTIEEERLWLLQVRPGKRSAHAALRMAHDMAENPSFPLTREQAVRRVMPQLVDPPVTWTPRGALPEPIARGLPASPGIVSGRIVTSPAEVMGSAESGPPVLLVRSDTSPEDVPAMARSAGVLTTRGGLASHAAVVARGWNIPAVVGAAEVTVTEGGVDIAGTRYGPEDVLTIDGSTGAVFAGKVLVDVEVDPEASTLLSWADELGVQVATPGAGETAPGSSARDAVPVTPEDALVWLHLKTISTPSALADCLMTSTEALEEAVGAVRGDGLVQDDKHGMLRLTEAGTGCAQALLEADRSRWGSDQAAAALDDFIPLDLRVKDAVSSWQMRRVDGADVVNDHTDAVHDAAVLDALRAVHADTMTWLSSLGTAIPRWTQYRMRFSRAVDAVDGGDDRFIASPRVDSYHSVWFELHEDLIRLAGRRREDEVAAGRA